MKSLIKEGLDYALHASLVCTRSHPKRMQITFRPLKTIDHDLLSTDIGKIDFNLDSKNVDSTIIIIIIIFIRINNYTYRVHIKH